MVKERQISFFFLHRVHFGRGLALIIVLWLLVVLATAAVSVIQAVRLENAARQIACENVQARWLARAGVHQALAAILEDVNTIDGKGDDWYDNQERFIKVSLGDGVFHVYRDMPHEGDEAMTGGVRDEASRLNLNTASLEELSRLEQVTPEIAAALIFQRERKPFSDLREVAQRTEFSEEFLFGEDRNLNGRLDDNENDGDLRPPADNQDGQLDRGLLAWLTVYSYERNVDGLERPRININTAAFDTLHLELELPAPMARWVLQNRGGGFTGIADLLVDDAVVKAAEEERSRMLANGQQPPDISPLTQNEFRRIVDRIAVTSEETIPGRVNINTAPREILATLPGLDDALAERLCAWRETLPDGFQTIGDVLDMPDMTIERFKLLASRITVRSNVFTIHSIGRCEGGKMDHDIEAVVDRGAEPDKLLYWRETR